MRQNCLIISFRLTNTGAWGYRFYEDGMHLGSVSCVLMPNATVRIEGPGISWYSSFNMDTTIVPGISRRVKDSITGEDIYHIIYCQPGFYRMIPNQMSSGIPLERRATGGILGEQREGAYLFGDQGKQVMAMTERIEEWP